jgi:hypothetical protein
MDDLTHIITMQIVTTEANVKELEQVVRDKDLFCNVMGLCEEEGYVYFSVGVNNVKLKARPLYYSEKTLCLEAGYPVALTEYEAERRKPHVPPTEEEIEELRQQKSKSKKKKKSVTIIKKKKGTRS